MLETIKYFKFRPPNNLLVYVTLPTTSVRTYNYKLLSSLVPFDGIQLEFRLVYNYFKKFRFDIQIIISSKIPNNKMVSLNDCYETKAGSANLVGSFNEMRLIYALVAVELID